LCLVGRLLLSSHRLSDILAGRLLPEHFPKIFGSTEEEPLDEEGTRKRFAQLTDEINHWRAKNSGDGQKKPLSVDEVRWS